MGSSTGPKVRLLCALVALGVGLAACAHGEERETLGDGSGRTTVDAVEGGTARSGSAAGGPAREISTDRAMATDPGAGTPAREASRRVVEEGKGYLIAGQPQEAARRFERATRIDPTNGFAYYYLGRARAESGDRVGAAGVAQKAEALLGPYPEWRERAARLAASLGAR
ncbi:MAG TPA: hypothetical protein VM737_09865 [Gemmatimonadota bacterium]|nr:hypothetical protein [Gemmatimonadota bacterium]